MGFADNILALRTAPAAPVEQRSELGSSAIPGPMSGGVGSFAAVDLSSTMSALQQVAIWAAQDLIASISSQLPVDTYIAQPGGNTNIPNPRVVDDPDGMGHGSQDWIYQYLTSKLSRGNVYGRQVFDANGYPTQVVLYDPEQVDGRRDRVTGEVQWRVCGTTVPASQMWHRRSYPRAGHLLGLSPVQVHATTIRLGIASSRFGAQFFSDSAIPSGLLTNDQEEIDSTIAKEVKARWMAAVYGTREPAVFGKGWKYEQLSLAPEESQFLETNKYSQAQCARIYGPNVAEILGYESGGSMTYANMVDRSIDFLKFTLNRHLRDVESTMSLWLPRGQFVKLNRAALLETDLLTRFKAYQTAIGSRFLAPSEARAYEDLQPLTPSQQEELASMPAAQPPKEDPPK